MYLTGAEYVYGPGSGAGVLVLEGWGKGAMAGGWVGALPKKLPQPQKHIYPCTPHK